MRFELTEGHERQQQRVECECEIDPPYCWIWVRGVPRGILGLHGWREKEYKYAYGLGQPNEYVLGLRRFAIAIEIRQNSHSK